VFKVAAVLGGNKRFGQKRRHLTLGDNDPVLLVNGVNDRAVFIEYGCRNQRFVISTRADVRDIKGKKPGQACSKAQGNQAAENKQKQDDLRMAQKFFTGRLPAGRSFFSGGFCGQDRGDAVNVEKVGKNITYIQEQNNLNCNP